MSRRLAAVALAAIIGCSAPPPGDGLAVDRVLDHVRMLSETIGPRPGGSPAATRAAAYVEERLVALGARPQRIPVGTIDVPAIAIGPIEFRPARREVSPDDDLVVRFGPEVRAGAAGALLLMAHYDSVPGAPGAVDDAASVGLLLELAGELADHPPGFAVWLAFTADEEAGLVGARRLAVALAGQVGFAIALDMVGTDGPLIVNGAGELIRGDDLRWLAAAADTAGVDLQAPWVHRIVSRWWPQIERADHGAFTATGVRAVHLMDRGANGERIYLAYHTPSDRLDQVSPAALDEAGRLLRGLVARAPPPRTDGDPGVWLPVRGNVVVPRWTFLAACAVLIAGALLGLITVRRRGMTRGPGLLAAAAVWIIATAIAVLIERLARGGHPAPWVHAPLRHELAAGLILVGVAVLAATVVARWRPWAGPDRFAIAAAIWNLAIGTAVVAIGAAEIAWLWLAPAELLAWVPGDRLMRGTRAGRVVGVIVAIAAVAPALVMLAPGFLREGYFHGFLPEAVPITVWIAVQGVTAALIAAHLASRIRRWGPGATFAVPALAITAVMVGTLVLGTYQPPCSSEDLALRRLSCELGK